MKAIKLGIIGFSKENGHPYSFSAIINGFDDKGMKKSGWDVIHSYLKKRKKSEFGFIDVEVTHVWTQNIIESRKIAKAAKIKNIVRNFHDMVDEVDGVIIARDDWKTHYEISKFFLEKGKFVFIDKPLSLNVKELQSFKKYLKSGKLMSCSCVRYAKELDPVRKNIKKFSKIKLVRGAVINDWEKYGVHMLDGIFSVIKFNAVSVQYVPSNHFSVIIKNKDKSIIQIDSLGKTIKTFQFDFWSNKNRFHAEINDNFSMFKRTLARFISGIKRKGIEYDYGSTMDIMRILIAANISKQENREVRIDEIKI